jgi:hypothetical protein
MRPEEIEGVEFGGSGALVIEIAETRDARAAWEAWLLGGAIRGRIAVEELPPVETVDVAGDVVAAGSPDAEHYPTQPTQIYELAERARSAAAAAGIELVRLEVVEPLGPALALTVVAPEPAAFLRRRLPGFVDALGTWSKRVSSSTSSTRTGGPCTSRPGLGAWNGRRWEPFDSTSRAASPSSRSSRKPYPGLARSSPVS